MANFSFHTKGFQDIYDGFGHMKHELHELSTHRVYIGALLPVNDRSVEFMQMICSVQNFGCEIKPVNGKFLTIPMPIARNHNAKYFGQRSKSNPNGLFFYMSKSGKPTLAANINGELKVFFLLSKQVNIPARGFINRAVDDSINHVAKIVENDANYYFSGDGNYRNTLNKVGRYISQTLKYEIKSWDNPPNAPITQANKGKNDPLVDTGALQESISWVIV